jgi:hypothetical protein
MMNLLFTKVNFEVWFVLSILAILFYFIALGVNYIRKEMKTKKILLDTMPYQEEYHYRAGESFPIGSRNMSTVSTEEEEFGFYIIIKKPDHFKIKNWRDCIRWLFYRVSPETYVIHGHSGSGNYAIVNIFFGYGDTTFIIKSSAPINIVIADEAGGEYEQELFNYKPHYTAPPNNFQTVFKI